MKTMTAPVTPMATYEKATSSCLTATWLSSTVPGLKTGGWSGGSEGDGEGGGNGGGGGGGGEGEGEGGEGGGEGGGKGSGGAYLRRGPTAR